MNRWLSLLLSPLTLVLFLTLTGCGGSSPLAPATDLLNIPPETMTRMADVTGVEFAAVYGINDNNQIVGISQDSPIKALLWSPGQGAQDLGLLPGTQSAEAMAVNNRGEVVGNCWDSQNYSHAFYWKPGEGMQEIGYFPGSQWANAMRINDNGVVAGYCLGDGSHTGFLWTPEDGLRNMNEAVGFGSFIIGINNNGDCVGEGEAGFVWSENEGTRLLEVLPGYVVSQAREINNRGDIVGECRNDFGDGRAVLWAADGTTTEIGTLPGFEWSVAMAINDSGDIVGFCYNMDNIDSRAFLWSEADGMQDLGSLPNTSYSRAHDINNNGTIVGECLDEMNNSVHFIWRPNQQ